MSIKNTVFVTPNSAPYSVPGAQTPEEIKAEYGDDIPGLASMTGTVTETGDTRTITFALPQDDKGATA